MQAAVNHFATPGFWFAYRQLPAEVRDLADKNFELLKHDPHHPSLRLKRSVASGQLALGYTTSSSRGNVPRDWFGFG